LQHVSAPGGAARSEPCPTSPLEPPARYALGAATPLCVPAASRQWTTRGQRVRQLLSQPSFAFPLEAGSPDSLAPNHLLDVGSLSGRASIPYPSHCKTTFASSSILSRSAIRFPCGSPALPGDWSGFPRSALQVLAGVGACYPPGSATIAKGCRSAPFPTPSPFGPSLSARLACST
jgi:hypothetical protein